MATGLDLSGLGQFDPYSDPTSISIRWKEWSKRFERFVVAMNLKDETRKRALLLYAAGSEVEKIFATLDDTGDDKDFKTAMECLNKYFLPKKNLVYEIHKFRQAKQMPNESVDQFTTRLRHLASTCDFTNLSQEIKIQLIEQCSSSRLRRKALREDMKLEDILAYARTQEATDQAVSQLEKDMGHSSVHDSENPINAVRQHKLDTYGGKSKPHETTTKKTCFHCGDKFQAGHIRNCKAKGKVCAACGKLNHFAMVCHSKPRSYSDNANVQAVHCDTSSSDEDYAFGVYSSPAQSVDNINQVAHQKKGTVISAKILDVPIKLFIDSGASANILDRKDFNKLKAKHPHINLTPSKLRLYAYMQADPLPLLGTVDTVIETKHRYVVAKFFCVSQEFGILVGTCYCNRIGFIEN